MHSFGAVWLALASSRRLSAQARPHPCPDGCERSAAVIVRSRRPDDKAACDRQLHGQGNAETKQHPPAFGRGARSVAMGRGTSSSFQKWFVPSGGGGTLATV